ncbi:MAG: DNA-binding protein [Microbacteriaceae bacterium]|nr:MAG: DNA-binding protein [Microbacteriaceae bacterium]
MNPASHPQQPIPGLDPMIDVHTLAAYLGVPVSTIYDWRTRHKGPAGHRFGKHVMFAVPDVKAWVAQQRDPASSADGR